MSELRKDPVINRWVIISKTRGERPFDFKTIAEEDISHNCPFCEGHEDMTPPEILSYRKKDTKPNTPGWWIRVVPNKFPALKIEGELQRSGEGMYDKMNGIGAHEVIIETPDHTKDISELSDEHVRDILEVYRNRIRDLKKDKRFEYALIFKNKGLAAGASLLHPHSQLIVTPIIPKRVKEEVLGAEKYYDYKDRCVFCDIISQEQMFDKRIVMENDKFIAICPFASRFPFEIWLLPKKHMSNFASIEDKDLHSFAEVFKGTLYKLNKALDNVPYNYIIHTAPLKKDGLDCFHWHIEIMPKLTNVAGFEWGSGFYINPTPPEDAAEFLRDIEVPK